MSISEELAAAFADYEDKLDRCIEILGITSNRMVPTEKRIEATIEYNKAFDQQMRAKEILDGLVNKEAGKSD